MPVYQVTLSINTVAHYVILAALAQVDETHSAIPPDAKPAQYGRIHHHGTQVGAR